MKTIVIDIDDCIANGSERCVRIFNRDKPDHIPLICENTIGYHSYQLLGISFLDFFNETHFQELLPIVNSVETLTILSEQYKILYLTARGHLRNGYDISKEWLLKYNYPLREDIDKLVVVSGFESKAIHLKNLNLDVEFVLDDTTKNIDDYLNNKVANSYYMIDRSWNRDRRDLDQYRIKNIKEILK